MSATVIVHYDAEAIEDTLKNLGAFRAAMKPEITKTFAMGQKVSGVHDPIWVSEPDTMEGNSLLHIRDPRYGWLHYVLPKGQARKLAGYLQTQADSEPPEPKSKSVN